MQENLFMTVPATEVVGDAESANDMVKTQRTEFEVFMSTSYEFRRNILADKYEVRQHQGPWRDLTDEAVNSIARQAKRELDESKSWRTSVVEYIHSEETQRFDPIAEYLNSLPVWDGQDRVRELFRRLSGISEEQISWCKTWLRSAVAHWLELDQLHANESVITLIGPQGCGKSTFCAQLLPPAFRSYYLDHVNLGNKFDKEMALTSNLVVNIDELDQIKPGKQAELKQMLSKIKVNGRPIFGRVQHDRRRFASFVATTNNPRPLQDPTGSRRYLCIEIGQNALICNDLPIEYDQLYAQVIYEVRAQGLPYWFSPDEVRRIEEHNLKFQHVSDIESMLSASFRRPMTDEVVKPILTREVVKVLSAKYPELKQTNGMNVKVGRLLKAMNFEQKDTNQGSAYYLVPIAA